MNLKNFSRNLLLLAIMLIGLGQGAFAGNYIGGALNVSGNNAKIGGSTFAKSFLLTASNNSFSDITIRSHTDLKTAGGKETDLLLITNSSLKATVVQLGNAKVRFENVTFSRLEVWQLPDEADGRLELGPNVHIEGDLVLKSPRIKVTIDPSCRIDGNTLRQDEALDLTTKPSTDKESDAPETASSSKEPVLIRKEMDALAKLIKEQTNFDASKIDFSKFQSAQVFVNSGGQEDVAEPITSKVVSSWPKENIQISEAATTDLEEEVASMSNDLIEEVKSNGNVFNGFTVNSKSPNGEITKEQNMEAVRLIDKYLINLAKFIKLIEKILPKLEIAIKLRHEKGICAKNLETLLLSWQVTLDMFELTTKTITLTIERIQFKEVLSKPEASLNEKKEALLNACQTNSNLIDIIKKNIKELANKPYHKDETLKEYVKALNDLCKAIFEDLLWIAASEHDPNVLDKTGPFEALKPKDFKEARELEALAKAVVDWATPATLRNLWQQVCTKLDHQVEFTEEQNILAKLASRLTEAKKYRVQLEADAKRNTFWYKHGAGILTIGIPTAAIIGLIIICFISKSLPKLPFNRTYSPAPARR